MKVNVAKSDKLKRELNVVVPFKAITTEKQKKLKDIAKKVKLDGFRPGKVPMSVVEKNYGESVMAEVLETVVQDSTREAMTQQGFRPAMRPKVDVKTFEEGKDFEFSLEFEVLPEVPDVDFKKIKVEEWKTDVTDEDIAEGLGRLGEQFKQYEKVDRAAKNGDAVIIDFVGKKDGVPFPGGTGNGTQLVLGSNQFIPGFEEKLVGVKAGDKRDLDLTFPKEYHSKDLAGKATVFEVTVQEVREATAGKQDDSFAKQIGFETIDKLKDALKRQFEDDYSGLTRTRMKKDLFDALDETLTFEIPESMVEGEFSAIWEQFQKSPEFAEKKKSEAELKKEYQRMAERRVRLGILLASIGEKQKIEVDQGELRQAVIEQARQYPGQERQVVDFYQKNPQMAESLRGPILEEKVVDYLLGNVTKKTKNVPVSAWHDQHDHGAPGHVHGPDCNH
jgi:trigger factor